jgi:hypothetical protein
VPLDVGTHAPQTMGAHQFMGKHHVLLPDQGVPRPPARSGNMLPPPKRRTR